MFAFKHEISLIKYAKPNQRVHFVRYNREFVITVIVITEFDCSCVFKEIALVGSNQGNYFENATACSKRTLKTTVATQL